MGAKDHVLRVDNVTDVVPGYRRVGFSSATLLDAIEVGPTDFLQMWFPDGAHPGREVQRGYTILDPDPAAGTFHVEFVLHEPAGPASRWALDATPGDEVVATWYGSRPFGLPEPEPAGVLVVADASAIPALNSILSVVPGHLAVEVLLEYHDDAEVAIPIVEHRGCRVTRLRQDHTGAAVVAALADRDLTGWYAWIGTERTTVKTVKAALSKRHGFSKADCKAQAYWMHGRSYGAERPATDEAVA